MMYYNGSEKPIVQYTNEASNHCIVKRIYSHISKEKKNQLIQTVLRQKCKIKKIAQDLNINYATAKTIIHNFKKKNVNHNIQSLKREAKYGNIKSNSKINLVITLNNSLISQRVYQMTPVVERNKFTQS